jgi:hypothetical protein
MKNAFFNVALLCILLLSLTACSKPMEQRILGKWQENNSSSSVHFFPDNTLLMTLLPNQQIGGTWLKVGDNTLKVDIVVNGVVVGTKVMEVTKLAGDTLEMDLDGQAGSFTRAK